MSARKKEDPIGIIIGKFIAMIIIGGLIVLLGSGFVKLLQWIWGL